MERCIIPELWCGKGRVPRRQGKRYTRKGTSFECMKKGFGAGMYKEKAKHLPENSLQRIKYIGETYEANFRRKRVTTLEGLVRKVNNLNTKRQKERFLKSAVTKANDVLDSKAYNSLMLFLYSHNVRGLPDCIDL